MWRNDNTKAPIARFLVWLLIVSLAVNVILYLLEPCSIAYSKTGKMTVGYGLYALLGMLFSTPAPAIALFITLRQREKISVREFWRRFISTPQKGKTAALTGCFCLAALAAALRYGESTGGAWYTAVFGFCIMLIFVGFAEETGWRGFLQPELEKRMPFPAATATVALIWWAWHLNLWLMPSSNHFGDSILGFAITIFVWSFVSAAIYKATKSVLACAVYHSFLNSLGAVYDWNALFDAMPKQGGMIVYYVVIFLAAIALWLISDRREKRAGKLSGTGNP